MRSLSDAESRLVLRACVWAVVLVAALTWVPPLAEELARLLAAITRGVTDPLWGTR